MLVGGGGDAVEVSFHGHLIYIEVFLLKLLKLRIYY